MGQKITKEQAQAGMIDVTDFRKRYIVNRQSEGLAIKGELKFVPTENPLIKELVQKHADRVRS